MLNKQSFQSRMLVKEAVELDDLRASDRSAGLSRQFKVNKQARSRGELGAEFRVPREELSKLRMIPLERGVAHDSGLFPQTGLDIWMFVEKGLKMIEFARSGRIRSQLILRSQTGLRSKRPERREGAEREANFPVGGHAIHFLCTVVCSASIAV